MRVSVYTRVLRPALFALDAERAHELTIAALQWPLVVGALARGHSIDRRLSQQVFGLDFSNPLGLAAGLDKQGTAVPAWAALGFGFKSSPYDLILMGFVTVFTLISVSLYLVGWVRHMSTIEAR